MKVLAIIAEFNPIHNGHIFLINQAIKKVKPDYIIILMSGNFTQQGNVAIYNKFVRSNLAIQNGADIVIELPTIYANSSAEYFATSSINLLSKLGIVTNIFFGVEDTNISILKSIVNKIIKSQDIINEKIKKNLKSGISYASARSNALKNILDEKEINIISKPNNILAIEYLKALKKFKSKIKPNSINILEGIKATNIRKDIELNNFEALKNKVPENTFKIVQNTKANFNDELFYMLKYKILVSNLNKIKNIYEVNEGLENKIIRSCYYSNTYEEMIKNIKSKRYVESKIKRIMINILLNIDKDLFENLFKNNITYAHVLSISKKGKKLLSEISKKSKIDVITSLSQERIKNLDINIQNMLSIDILASNIYSIIEKTDSNKDFTNKL